MPNLTQAITQYPLIGAFRRVEFDGDDPREWEYVPVPGEVVADADQDGFYVVGAMNVRSKNDIRRCYMDISTPDRINDYAYVFDGGELRYDYPYKLGGEVIPSIAIDCFGLYLTFYSKAAPELGIDVLRRGLAVSKRKHYIAEDLGYIYRDEKRYREAAEMFQLAADEQVSSYFIYGELAQAYAMIGDPENERKYLDLYQRNSQVRHNPPPPRTRSTGMISRMRNWLGRGQ